METWGLMIEGKGYGIEGYAWGWD